jgi:asparagine synthase (glutamine-hydrolysing)
MRLARQSGVIVLLDGQGADELFGGYRPFRVLLRERIRTVGIRAAFQELREIRSATGDTDWQPFVDALAIEFTPGGLAEKLVRRKVRHGLVDSWKGLGVNEDYIRRSGATVIEDRSRWLSVNGRHEAGLDAHLRDAAQNTSLPLLLRFEDRNSMAFAVEGRTPFLDYRLVEFAFSKALPWKIFRGWTKWPLRRSMEGRVPKAILWRRDKVGFETPEESILCRTAQLRPNMFGPGCEAGRWCDWRRLRGRWRALAAGDRDRTGNVRALWRAVCLDKWLSGLAGVAEP